ncbi:LysM peptidoglycan-binding domain-containing protein [Candidatus Woesearchaeota archaeon]|nr:LysM peptidoglycan-binding domain-containing protein [Candidatus Woesearchaeota archaeon]
MGLGSIIKAAAGGLLAFSVCGMVYYGFMQPADSMPAAKAAEPQPVYAEASVDEANQQSGVLCYTVQPGDTLSEITVNTLGYDHTLVDVIAGLSNIKNSGIIEAGQQIYCPDNNFNINQDVPEEEPAYDAQSSPEEQSPAENPAVPEYSKNLSMEEIREVAFQVFPANVAEYFARLSSECEVKDGNTGAIGGAGERGLWQIHPVHAATFPELWEDWQNPYSNAQMAYIVSTQYMPDGVFDLSPWTCQAVLGLPAQVTE